VDFLYPEDGCDTSQKTAFFIVTAVITSNLTYYERFHYRLICTQVVGSEVFAPVVMKWWGRVARKQDMLVSLCIRFHVHTVMTVKNTVFGDVSEESSDSNKPSNRREPRVEAHRVVRRRGSHIF
jgi:hypothetical protein